MNTWNVTEIHCLLPIVRKLKCVDGPARLQTFLRDKFILRRHLTSFRKNPNRSFAENLFPYDSSYTHTDGCINIKVRNFVPRRKIFNWESTLDVQTHYKDRKTFQCTNFYTFHPSGANKEFVKGEVLHLLGTNSSRSTFNKKRTEFQNTHKEWRIPRWQFWEVYLGSYFCRWERLDWEHKEENNFFCTISSGFA